MQVKLNHRRGKWAAGVGATAIATGLIVSLGFGTTAASAASNWNGNGAPSFLKTAPTGTPIGAPAKNTIFACVPVPLPNGQTVTVGQTVGTTLTQAQTPWVQDGKVVISKIERVPGSVKMKSVFKVTENKNTRLLKGNGIPNHPIGIFPIPRIPRLTSTTPLCRRRGTPTQRRFRSSRTTWRLSCRRTPRRQQSHTAFHR